MFSESTHLIFHLYVLKWSLIPLPVHLSNDYTAKQLIRLHLIYFGMNFARAFHGYDTEVNQIIVQPAMLTQNINHYTRRSLKIIYYLNLMLRAGLQRPPPTNPPHTHSGTVLFFVVCFVFKHNLAWYR